MLKVENLRKVFRTEEIETIALNGVSFDVDEGEFVAVVMVVLTIIRIMIVLIHEVILLFLKGDSFRYINNHNAVIKAVNYSLCPCLHILSRIYEHITFSDFYHVSRS